MAFITSRSRFGGTVVGAVAALALAAAPASAQVLEKCPAVAMSQPFAPWLDFADYVLMPGGDMEAGGARWTLSGGAAIVDGNEPFRVGGWRDRASLRLPPGSSATTVPMCVATDYPTLRFFAKRDGGSLLGSLLVEALITDAAGYIDEVPIALVENTGTWAPTRPLAIGVSALAVDDPMDVSFRFTPQGHSQWTIDDVYVDPYRTI